MSRGVLSRRSAPKRPAATGAGRRKSASQATDAPQVQQLIEELESSRKEILLQHAQLVQAHAETAEARDLYAELYDFAPIGYLLLDAEGAIHESNIASSKILGRQRRRMSRVPLGSLVLPDQQRMLRRFLQHVLDDPSSVHAVEVRLKTRPERTVRLVTRAAPAGSRARRYFTAMTDVTAERRIDNERHDAFVREQARARDLAREVTERAVAEAQIKLLLQRIVTVQEDERRRLSRDLHDELGQQLTALRLSISMLKRITGDPSVQHQVAVADDIAAALDRDLDHLAWALRPAELDEFGLKAALKAYLDQWSNYHQIAALLHAPLRESRFPIEIESHVYRLVQEALNNVVKHARATRVRVSLTRTARRLTVTIRDNGRGFNASAPSKKSCIGLLGMRERAALIGGELEIESKARHGTTIAVRVPLPN